MHNRKIIFFVSSIGIFVFGLGLTTLGSLAIALQQKFHLDEVGSGTLFSILPLGILAGSLLFGPVADRYGYKMVLSVASLLMFAGFEGIAFAQSTLILKIAIFVFAMGGGAINGGTSAVVADVSKNKGTALSLLGVFFGLGALGMPFFIGILGALFSISAIISFVGLLALVSSISFLLLRYPQPKQQEGTSFRANLRTLNDSLLITIAFFLFCQSSFEGIINNWTTTYLTQRLSVHPNTALYALTLHLTGMTVSRLLLGTVFRQVKPQVLLFASLGCILIGCLLLYSGGAIEPAIAGLIFLGAGLGGGFPIMLGFVGNRYAEMSGTAFSFVLVIALIGNMLVNYFMGVVAKAFGIHHLITFALAELVVMTILCLVIVRRVKSG